MGQLLANGRLDNNPKLTLWDPVRHSQYSESNSSFLDDGLGSCIEM